MDFKKMDKITNEKTSKTKTNINNTMRDKALYIAMMLKMTASDGLDIIIEDLQPIANKIINQIQNKNYDYLFSLLLYRMQKIYQKEEYLKFFDELMYVYYYILKGDPNIIKKYYDDYFNKNKLVESAHFFADQILSIVKTNKFASGIDKNKNFRKYASTKLGLLMLTCSYPKIIDILINHLIETSNEDIYKFTKEYKKNTS